LKPFSGQLMVAFWQEQRKRPNGGRGVTGNRGGGTCISGNNNSNNAKNFLLGKWIFFCAILRYFTFLWLGFSFCSSWQFCLFAFCFGKLFTFCYTPHSKLNPCHPTAKPLDTKCCFWLRPGAKVFVAAGKLI